jgi:MoaA/NifB/PqqE/SkfB family radical SAM enzyme
MSDQDSRALAFVSGEPGPGPETLHVDLTNACNFHCIYCWHYSPLRLQPVTREWGSRRLPTAMAVGAIRDAAELGTPRILFSGGGEPLLHPDAYSIFEQCGDLGLKVTLISNLSVVDLRRIGRAPPEKILANCSAATEATYLATHPGQRPTAWTRFQERVRALAAMSQITLVFVVTRHNLADVEQMLTLAAELGAVRVQYKLADLPGELASAGVDESHRLALLARLGELRARASTLGVEATIDAFERELAGARRGLVFVQSVGCYVGWYYARIGADGAVYACCKNVPIGRLDKASFAELWRGQVYEDFRAHTRARDFSRWPRACAACGNLSLNVRVAKLIQTAVVPRPLT